MFSLVIVANINKEYFDSLECNHAHYGDVDVLFCCEHLDQLVLCSHSVLLFCGDSLLLQKN